MDGAYQIIAALVGALVSAVISVFAGADTPDVRRQEAQPVVERSAPADRPLKSPETRDC